MEQGLVPAAWMDRRLSILEKDTERRAAYEQPDYQWNFRVDATCPPSTTINMRGGRVWGDPSAPGLSGESWYVESASYDLTEFDDTGYTYTFTNAYYYKPLAVMLRWSGAPGATIDYPLRILTSAEQATAAEAEQITYPAWPDGRFDPDAYYGIPLAIVIVRNNGNTTAPNQFMAVDPVNRGRSYIWRNLKVRFMW